MDIVDNEHLEIDFVFRSKIISFGLTIGSNSSVGGKFDNIFLEIDFLFWSLGIEVKNLRKANYD